MLLTPLNALHLELGAKMVTYAGYHMPIHYRQGIIQEHLHCRRYAGLFDLSHMGHIELLGEDVCRELQQLTPSILDGLRLGQQKYTLLTHQNGGILDDIVVTRTETGLMLVVNAACKAKDFGYLNQQLASRCQVNELRSQALLALQGPGAVAIMQKISSRAAALTFMQACTDTLYGIPCTISRSGYTGEDGFELSVADSQVEDLARQLLAEDDVAPIGLGARDTLRLEAGLCLYGHELNEHITPVEAGLHWVISKEHRHFPGANKILGQLRTGAACVRVGLDVAGKLPLREDTLLLNQDDVVIGRVTSGSFSPSLGKPIAMALVDKHYAELGTRLSATVRAHRLSATVTSLPFVAHRYQR